jgi:glycosyltransferase involved in cell wall biosynthesis
MKVILAHKFFHLVGGTEVYFQNLADILQAHGHKTVPFAMQDPRNPESEFSKYFVSPLDFSKGTVLGKIPELGKIVSRSLYSFEARKKVGALIRDQQPDIAHLQAIENHISPSIIDEFKKHGIPIVQSVNMYKHVCASYRLYLTDRQEICERCRGGHHYHAVLTRCLKGSLVASTLAALEMYLHQSIMRIYHRIDRFIVPNAFMEDKLVEAGYDRSKMIRLRNPFQVSQVLPAREPGDFILYFGRIEPEKGVLPLVKAMGKLPSHRLVVVGDGSQLPACRKWANDNGVGNIEFAGPKWGDELLPYLSDCSLVVVPSIWNEPSPYVIYQSLAMGKPIVGSRVGGIPDLITPETGILAEPGNVDDLAEKIDKLNSDKGALRSMGQNARVWAEQNLSPENYYERIMETYEDICGRSLR